MKRTLADLMERLEPGKDNWFRFKWKAFDVANLGMITKNADWIGSHSDWQTAWHGTKMETLYKVMSDGHLSESGSLPGQRILENKPGL